METMEKTFTLRVSLNRVNKYFEKEHDEKFDEIILPVLKLVFTDKTLEEQNISIQNFKTELHWVTSNLSPIIYYGEDIELLKKMYGMLKETDYVNIWTNFPELSQ